MTTAHPAKHSSGDYPALQPWQTELQLNHGNHLRLRAEQNLRVRTVRGVAWITLEMEPGETLVSPGDSFVVSSGKTALVGPLHQSVTLELGVAPEAIAPAASQSLLLKLCNLLRLNKSLGLDLA